MTHGELQALFEAYVPWNEMTGSWPYRHFAVLMIF